MGERESLEIGHGKQDANLVDVVHLRDGCERGLMVALGGIHLPGDGERQLRLPVPVKQRGGRGADAYLTNVETSSSRPVMLAMRSNSLRAQSSRERRWGVSGRGDAAAAASGLADSARTRSFLRNSLVTSSSPLVFRTRGAVPARPPPLPPVGEAPPVPGERGVEGPADRAAGLSRVRASSRKVEVTEAGVAYASSPIPRSVARSRG